MADPIMVICPCIVIFVMVHAETVRLQHNLVGVVQQTDYRAVMVVVWYGKMRHQHHAGEHQRHYGDFPVHLFYTTKIQLETRKIGPSNGNSRFPEHFCGLVDHFSVLNLIEPLICGGRVQAPQAFNIRSQFYIIEMLYKPVVKQA